MSSESYAPRTRGVPSITQHSVLLCASASGNRTKFPELTPTPTMGVSESSAPTVLRGASPASVDSDDCIDCGRHACSLLSVPRTHAGHSPQSRWSTILCSLFVSSGRKVGAVRTDEMSGGRRTLTALPRHRDTDADATDNSYLRCTPTVSTLEEPEGEDRSSFPLIHSRRDGADDTARVCTWLRMIRT